MNTHAEDVVLIGAITRKTDLEFARMGRWYRIPEAQMPYGIHAKVLGVFLNSQLRAADHGAVSYYAEITGYELALRRDLLPNETRNADQRYFRVSLGELIPKTPPVINQPHRPISFIQTTWDRFAAAATIRDLYTRDDAFVDRVQSAFKRQLKGQQVETGQRLWHVDRVYDAAAPALRIPCNNGAQIVVTLNANAPADALRVTESTPIDSILREIFARIDQNEGLISLSVPLE